MRGENRRKEIALLLASAGGAITGASLSEKFGVSRQIIVQDISRLKAQGYTIVATHGGYVLKASPLKERVVKVYHDTKTTEDELRTIIANGGIVADVFVQHQVYGKLRADLNLYDDASIDKFIEGVRSGKSVELMNVTGGHHYHTIRAAEEKTLDAVEKALKEKGFLVQD
ncbi:MAG: transcription repressor NadR [Clostridia bacterium]|nr:transcription repressor NadR [Clostridia bacterium]